MIIQKKADRRKKRQVDSAKVPPTPIAEKQPPPVATREAGETNEELRYDQGDYKRTPKPRTEEVHQATPKYMASPAGQGDAMARSPKNQSAEISSPTDKSRPAGAVYNKAVLNNNTSYTNYHQQPQQPSFAVGK